MGGIKRKSADAVQPDIKSKSKTIKSEKSSSKHSAKKDVAHRPKPSKKPKLKDDSDELMESNTSEDENGLYGFSASKEPSAATSEAEDDGEDEAKADNSEDSKPEVEKRVKKVSQEEYKTSALAALNANSSREAHAKQKVLAKERKAAKPNADIIERSKKLWEKLRLKSHTEKEERNKLVAELFEIVTGRVKDFVFKHDSVRVVQCAVKYSNMEQRRMIARELKGEFKILAEGKYSKFLIAKLLEKGDPEIQEMIISEFYGHVRRLMNHPEAAWILDDTYRQMATSAQKTRLLREWYGAEYSIQGLKPEGPITAELSAILEESPEKRKPIMEHLEMQINQLIQKKLTGFTMLHDAMLQYFLACKPGTSEANDFLEHLKPDTTLKEGEDPDNVDLLKNLAFTKPGSRLVSLALAYGTAKDRKLFLRPYKDTIHMMAFDVNAHHVLLAAMAVVDDTKLTSKSIFGELLPTNDTLADKVLELTNDVRARTVLLYPFASDSKWLLDDNTRDRLSELYTIRATTSKKDPTVRLLEITKNIEAQLLTAITSEAAKFASFSFGLQFIGEVLVGAPEVEPKKRKESLAKIASLSQEILDGSLPSTSPEDKVGSHGKNMLKTLVQGGKFDPKTRKVVPVEPALGFADIFWDEIKGNVIQWATGPGSFVIVGLVEAEGFERKDEVLAALKKDRKKLEAAAGPSMTERPKEQPKKQKKGKKNTKDEKAEVRPERNAGARLLLEKL